VIARPDPSGDSSGGGLLSRIAASVVVWGVAWIVMFLLDGAFSLGNLALVLILASATTGLWLTPLVSMMLSAGAIVLFNWLFVDPRLTFHVDLHQDSLLLVTMLAVSSVVGYLMASLRHAALSEALHVTRLEQLMALSDGLRNEMTAEGQFAVLLKILHHFSGQPVSALVLHPTHPSQPPRLINPGQDNITFLESPNTSVQEKLRQALSNEVNANDARTQAIREKDRTTCFVMPICCAGQPLGAIALHEGLSEKYQLLGIDHLRELCNLLGGQLDRAVAVQSAQFANEQAKEQQLRNTLLTSISHDYRTPLATLMGAASAIADQATKIGPDKIAALAKTILGEADQLNRMTSNTLQLARLDSAKVNIRKNWESIEEILGTVLPKARRNYPTRSFKVALQPGLPLLECDAILLNQLFDNLIENSVKHSNDASLIQVNAAVVNKSIEVTVIDSGAGIPDQWKERVFDVFQRIDDEPRPSDANGMRYSRRGMGVGLAVCRAIARVHQGKIVIEDALGGGTTVRLQLPVAKQPSIAAIALGEAVS